MRPTSHLSPGEEPEEDPEYGFPGEDRADLTLMSLEKLQLLVAELRADGSTPQAIERVCDYVVGDPVYDVSTRAVFRCVLENLRRSVG